jgi:hypothetical protein
MMPMYRSILALCLGLVSLWPTASSAQLPDAISVRQIVFDESSEVLTVQVDSGILLFDGPDGPNGTGAPTFLCESSWSGLSAQARWVFRTGGDRVVIAGEGGSFLSQSRGCSWSRTSGEADSARIVGAHAPQPGGSSILYAITSSTAPDVVARTDDGGFTSTVSGAFSVLDRDLTGLSGSGDTVIVLGEAPVTGAVSAWMSTDAGATFEVWPVDAPEGSRLVGLGGEVAWLSSGGGFLSYGLEDADGLGELAVEGVVATVVGQEGVLWLASDGGVVRAEPTGEAETVFELEATAVAVRGDVLWLGLRAEAPGAPLVRHLEGDGSSWVDAATWPESWVYPAACQVRLRQECAGDESALAGPEPESPIEEDPAGSGSGSGCSSAARTGSTESDQGLWLVLSVLMLALSPVLRNRRRPASP